jgi:hypothetical protein
MANYQANHYLCLVTIYPLFCAARSQAIAVLTPSGPQQSGKALSLPEGRITR